MKTASGDKAPVMVNTAPIRNQNGDVELVEVDGKYIYVDLTGACSGCQLAATTLGGIQQHLAEGLGEFVQVLPAEELARRATAGV